MGHNLGRAIPRYQVPAPRPDRATVIALAGGLTASSFDFHFVFSQLISRVAFASPLSF